MLKAGIRVIDVGVISGDTAILRHIEDICTEFGYSLRSWPQLETFMEAEPACRVVIVNTSEHKGSSQNNAAECCQAAKGVCAQGGYNDAFVVCIVKKTIKKDHLGFLKKSGADLILLDEELVQTSKIEFLLTQQLKARFVPIKPHELYAEGLNQFHVYHLIQHRSKFLPCALPGNISASRLIKLRQASELYVARRELGLFKQYIEARPSRSSKELLYRCRIRFLCLCSTYADLVLLLSDQAEQATLDHGTTLLNECRDLCSNLASVIAEFENVWDIIDASAIGNMGSVERSTAVATYVAVFGLKMNIENIEEVMIGALLCDVGLLLLSSTLLKKLKLHLTLHQDEFKKYSLHPLKSIEAVLARKVQLNPRLRKIIEMTHERADGKGFPHQPLAARIPIESQLIQFCQELDSRILIRIGETKRDPWKVRQEWILEAMNQSDRFNFQFRHQLKFAWGNLSDDSKFFAQKNRKVFIIDDQIKDCEIISLQLRKFGILAEFITDPQVAILEITEGLPDTVILDMNMHSFSGSQLLKQIRAIANYSPAIFLISDQASLPTDDVLTKSASVLFQKPFDYERLAQAIAQEKSAD